MNTDLTSGVSLMSEIIEYLALPDVAKARSINRFMKTATEQRHGNWRHRVKMNVPGVRDCSVCEALLRTHGPLNTLHKSAAWCVLCESVICVNHLEQCHTCGIISCSSCQCC